MTDLNADSNLAELAEMSPKAYRDKPCLVIFYYLEEYSMAEIARAFDVSEVTIQRHMRKHNLPRREAGF